MEDLLSILQRPILKPSQAIYDGLIKRKSLTEIYTGLYIMYTIPKVLKEQKHAQYIILLCIPLEIEHHRLTALHA